jgi:hypothetical protein
LAPHCDKIVPLQQNNRICFVHNLILFSLFQKIDLLGACNKYDEVYLPIMIKNLKMVVCNNMCRIRVWI